MTQYIDKSTLMEEIERRRDLHYKYYRKNGAGSIAECKYDEDRDILSFIDTLEVKEIDLEKEIQAFAKMELEHIKIYDANVGITITMHQLYQCAKHFLELGLKAKQISEDIKIGETEIYLNDDGGEAPYDGKQWLDLSCTEYEIPKDKFKDGNKVELIIRKKKGE